MKLLSDAERGGDGRTYVAAVDALLGRKLKLISDLRGRISSVLTSK
jgi:hypothetical protein